tara:strand:- start:654 stop:959 length:306 start_codon:yes stop_codon:yes gene_type:complete
MKQIIFLTLGFSFLISCAGVKDAGKVLRNEKITNTDEFLVKKKTPLSLPPNYEEIPEPGSIKKKKEKEEDKIKKLLKTSEEGKSNSVTSSTEQSILNKIRK